MCEITLVKLTTTHCFMLMNDECWRLMNITLTQKSLRLESAQIIYLLIDTHEINLTPQSHSLCHQSRSGGRCARTFRLDYHFEHTPTMSVLGHCSVDAYNNFVHRHRHRFYLRLLSATKYKKENPQTSIKVRNNFNLTSFMQMAIWLHIFRAAWNCILRPNFIVRLSK